MGSINAVIWCLAYIVGLLMAAVPLGGAIAFLVGIMLAIALPKFKPGFTTRVWIIAGIIALLAGFYLQIRTPQPNANDISQFIADKSQEVTVQGVVEELPRLTRSQKSQVWLSVTALEGRDRQVTGKLYVTLPQKDGQDLYPGQAIAIQGFLYKPKPMMNPGGFDFQKFLARQGSFAGLRGEAIRQLDPNQKPKWGWWMIRQKIVRSHLKQLGDREGALVSAMVLGSRAVDIPFDIKDDFARIGLSHALAASGFQVSLILSIVLMLTKRLPTRMQVSCGAIALIVFLCLTGMQPAVVRAVLMGFAVLLGLTFDRKVKSLNSLLLVATTLLFANPIWIWDLGFQFSFLATLGLLVTVPTLSKWLDWLPTIIVPAIAVPIAAFLWTLPIQLYNFGVVSPYSIPANIAATLFISFISIGGVISAIFNLVLPFVGDFIAPVLYFPTHWLIAGVQFCCRLPGNLYAVGAISIVVTIALYALICLPWFQPKYQRQWWILLLIGVAIVFVPAAYLRANLLQVTAISAGRDPILVIQDRGRIGLINSGDSAIVGFTVLPFLRKQGVNQIDWAIAAHSTTSNGWSLLAEQVPIRNLYELANAKKSAIDPEALQFIQAKPTQLVAGQTLKLGAIAVRPLSSEPAIVQIQIDQKRWLWMREIPTVEQRKALPQDKLTENQVLWWSGRKVHPKLLKILQPETAIAYSSKINSETLTHLALRQTQVYETDQEGAVQWTPQQGFKTTLELSAADASLL